MKATNPTSALAAITASVAVLLASMSFGENTFLGGNTLVGDAINWSDGVLPTVTTGVITNNSNGKIGNGSSAAELAATGLRVLQTGSVIGSVSFNGSKLTNCTWTVDGGQLGTGAISFYKSTVTINPGGKLHSDSNNRDITFTDGSSLTVNSGATVECGDEFLFSSSGNMIWTDVPLTCNNMLFGGGCSATISNSTITINASSGAFGTRRLSANGNVTLAGCTISAYYFLFNEIFTVTFGGTTPGTATFMDWGTDLYDKGYPTGTPDHRTNDQKVKLDFLAGTKMSLTMTAPRALDFTNDSLNNPVYAANEWAKALWETNRLLYNGQSAADLGKTWAEVTAPGGLGPKTYFNFTGTTLSLVTITYPPGTVIRFQ